MDNFSQHLLPASQMTLYSLSSWNLLSYLIAFPIGALYFGWRGDLFGRKRALIQNILLSAMTGMGIGMVPNFAAIGSAAPIALALLRLLQCFALSGLYGASAAFIAEIAQEKFRGLQTSLLPFALAWGMPLALLTLRVWNSYQSEDEFSAWGWRLPSICVGLILLLIALFARKKITETTIFSQSALNQSGQSPLQECFRDPASRHIFLFLLFGVAASQGAIWYSCNYFPFYFLRSQVHINSDSINLIMMLAVFTSAPALLFFGGLSDRMDRKKIMLAGLLGFFLLALPIHMMMVRASGFLFGNPFEEVRPDILVLTVLIFLLNMFSAMLNGPALAFLADFFSPRLRATGLSLLQQIGFGIFGGLAPLLGSLVISYTENLSTGAVYPMILAIISYTIFALFIHSPIQR